MSPRGKGLCISGRYLGSSGNVIHEGGYGGRYVKGVQGARQAGKGKEQILQQDSVNTWFRAMKKF